MSSLELSDTDDASYHGRIQNVGGDSVEAAVGDRADASTIEFTLYISGPVVVNLSRIRFDTYYFTSATGVTNMDWTFETIIGRVASNTQTGGFSHDGGTNYQSPDSASADFALSGLTNLSNTSVVFRWTLNGDKNHTFNTRNMGLDDIVLTGISVDASSYLAWAFEQGLSGEDALPDADTVDLDGMVNTLEAWFGTNPFESDTTGLYMLSVDELTTSFTHPYNENPPSDISASYQWSPNLVDWYACDGVDGPLAGARISATSVAVDGTKTVTLTASESMQQFFVRANVIHE